MNPDAATTRPRSPQESWQGWHDITRPLSAQTPVWQGDQAFELRQQRVGDLLVTALTTTCHIGTHVDAPLHLDPEHGGGVETIPVARLLGPAEVVRAEPRGELVTQESLPRQWRPVRPRLLLRTDSHPLHAAIAPGFAGLDPDLVGWLAGHGVELVGIDSPSVDPFDDDQLPAHHALLQRDMTWIEGLWLGDVEPGFYDLVALPLPLVGADAAPLRACLRRS